MSLFSTLAAADGRCMIAEVQRQADRIRPMLAELDIDESPAPLMAMAQESVSDAN
jgi:hypothetical protein